MHTFVNAKNMLLKLVCFICLYGIRHTKIDKSLLTTKSREQVECMHVDKNNY